MKTEDLLKIDNKHVWHPYSSMNAKTAVYPIASANGVRLKMADGKDLIDGMSSWWCAIHGYNHPVLNQAIETQLKKMSHVMFGGLTHEPAIELAKLLVEITPNGLDNIFYSDSGSVSVEVALKMAIQYWQAKKKKNKKKFISLRRAYHGDTFATMSVSDPETGMHSLFSGALTDQYYIESPRCKFGHKCEEENLTELKILLETEKQNIAALIVEPVVQGAGGMRFYSADYLNRAKELCKKHDVLMIMDEIATGFGRTGALFACDYSDVSPDIMCIGKALTGGYLSLAATLSSQDIARTIGQSEPGVFMHGPTFMANPLACSVSIASIKLLLNSEWQADVKRIEAQLKQGLEVCATAAQVKEVRVLGAIGVVELQQEVDMKSIQQQFVDKGVWVRPFGKLVYLMPPYIIETDDLAILIEAVVDVVTSL